MEVNKGWASSRVYQSASDAPSAFQWHPWLVSRRCSVCPFVRPYVVICPSLPYSALSFFIVRGLTSVLRGSFPARPMTVTQAASWRSALWPCGCRLGLQRPRLMRWLRLLLHLLQQRRPWLRYLQQQHRTLSRGSQPRLRHVSPLRP